MRMMKIHDAHQCWEMIWIAIEGIYIIALVSSEYYVNDSVVIA